MTSIQRKPKQQKQATILSRQQFSNGAVLYTCLRSNGVDRCETTLYNGHATGCTCRTLPDGRTVHGVCYHQVGCQEAEAKRASDEHLHVAEYLAQHGEADRQAVYSCNYCGKPMKRDGVCWKCAA